MTGFPCNGDRCKGRIFGGWSSCEHGIRGRLAELDEERVELLQALESVATDSAVNPSSERTDRG